MTLNWQTWHMRFVAGLNQGNDPRTLEAPELAVCKDVMFDKTGTLQTRYPFALLGTDIVDGGTLSDVRRVVENGPELLCFTKDKLYSWSPALSAWAEKATHYAVAIEEASRFVTTGEQITPDRCEMDGEAVFAWIDADRIWVAAIDTTTDTVTLTPTDISAGKDYKAPRLIALSSKILLLAYNDTDDELTAKVITPGAVRATAVNALWTTVASGGQYTDACRIPGADAVIVVASAATSYDVHKIDSALTVTSVSKSLAAGRSVGIAVTPDGAKAQIIRSNAGALVGDLIDVSTLADINTSTAIGTTDAVNDTNWIAIEYLPTPLAGVYFAYVWWSYGQEASVPSIVDNWQTRWNTVGTDATTQTEAVFAYRYSPRSRAFVRDGLVHLWMGFFEGSSFDGTTLTPQLQNTYFLYNSDGALCGKAVATEAGMEDAQRVGWLPTVQNLGDDRYAFCATERRIARTQHTTASAGPGKLYAARAPREVVFTFDSDDARRCVRLGKTLYVTGGEVKQYDGTNLVEVGFHVYPYFVSVSTTAGSLPDGDYSHKSTYRWDNALGETERSTTALIGTTTITAGPKDIGLDFTSALFATHKSGVAVEWWRTVVNPTEDSPYYLVTSLDPSVTSGDNSYLSNDPASSGLSSVTDSMVDADIIEKQTNDENGGILENVAPPPATLIAASTDRIFLAGIANRPDEVRYSKQRAEGSVASFHEALSVTVPPGGGSITALAILDGTPIVFRERAIHALVGDGFDNAGGGQNYAPREVSHDVGAVSQESVVVTERGVFFHSSKGKWLLNKGWQLEYVGGNVMDFDDEAPLAVHAIATRHEIRWLTSARMLVLNTLAGQWSEWTIADGIHACMWNGAHVYLSSTGPKQEQTTYAGVDYGMVVETAWVKLGDLQNYGKVDHFLVLGEYRSAHRLQIQCARDYWKDGDGTFFHDKTWTVSPTTVGARESVKHAPSIKQVEAIKIRITALGAGVAAAPSGEALKLTGLSFELGFERGLNRQLPSAQRQ